MFERMYERTSERNPLPVLLFFVKLFDSFVDSLVFRRGRSFVVRSSIGSFVIRSCVHAYMSFARSFIRSPVRPLVRPYVRLSVRPSVCSFVRSSGHPFV